MGLGPDIRKTIHCRFAFSFKPTAATFHDIHSTGFREVPNKEESSTEGQERRKRNEVTKGKISIASFIDLFTLRWSLSIPLVSTGFKG